MASGDIVGIITGNSAPGDGIARAGRGVRMSATSEELWPILLFDDTTPEFWDLFVAFAGYDDSSGVTINYAWTSATATSGDVGWYWSLRNAGADEDIDLSHTYSYQSGLKTAPSGSAGKLVYSTQVFTHAQMDGIVSGESGVLRVKRDDGVGPMTGDAQLILPLIWITET